MSQQEMQKVINEEISNQINSNNTSNNCYEESSFQQAAGKAYSKLINLLSSVAPSFEEEEKEEKIKVGPYDFDEWQSMLIEANNRIRLLQMDKTNLKKQLTNYYNKLDQLITTQQNERQSLKLQLETIKSKSNIEKIKLEEEISNLNTIKNDMEKNLKKIRNEKLKLENEIIEQEKNPPKKEEKKEIVETDNKYDISYWKQKALAFEAQFHDIKLKYQRELKERRKYYNQIQNLKGNIRVFVRCRPLLDKEIKAGYKNITSFPDEETISIINKKNITERFKFNKVFTNNDSNEFVYNESIQPYIQSLLDGYNVTLFAYGQTGSGKTYTMNNMNKSSIEEIFNKQNESNEWKFNNKLSFLEIYNEKIIDLLDDDKNYKKEYKIRLDTKNNRTYVEGIKEFNVNNFNQVFNLIKKGNKNRTVAQTNMNHESSRSHSLLVLNISAINKTNKNIKFESKLNLIDLAGSERVKKSNVDGIAMKEAQNINRSLSSLGDVIESLLKKQKHIPYRNSKLTFILQDSIGNSAKTLMFINLSPADYHSFESITSLKFGSRANKVELGQAKKNYK